MNKCIKWFLFLYFIIIHCFLCQAQPCEIKGAGNLYVNNGNVGGNLYQGNNIGSLTINVYLSNSTFIQGDGLYSSAGKTQLPVKGSQLKLDTANKALIAREIFKNSSVDECLREMISTKINNGKFDIYKSADNTIKVVQYRLEEGELGSYNLKTVYELSDGVSLVKDLNKYYYIKPDKKHLIPIVNDEDVEYDFATDFHKGIALVGDYVDSKKLKYYFITKKGVPRDTVSYCDFFSVDDLYFLKRTSDSINQLYSKDGSLLVENIDALGLKSVMPLKFYVNGIPKDVQYIKQIDTLKSDIGLYIKSTVLNDFILTDKIGNIFYRSPVRFTSPESLRNIFTIKKGDLLLIINTDTHKICDKYYGMQILEDNASLFKVRKISGKWNLINEDFKELLENDYTFITLKGSNLIGVKNSNGESVRYILKNNRLKLDGYYSELTQLDNWGYGFWLRKDKDVIWSGLYTKSITDTFPKFNCVRVGTYPFYGQINYFGGFNNDQVAIVKGEYIDQAVMNKSRQFLLPFDCQYGYNNISLQALQQGTIVKYEDKNHFRYSFLVRDGIKRCSDYSEIQPLNSASLFKVSKGSAGLNVGLINLKGDVILPPSYYAISSIDSFGFLQVDSIDKGVKIYKLMDTLCNWVTKSFYFAIKRYKLGFIAGKVNNNQWNILNFKGDLNMTYLPYADIEILSRNLLLVTTERSKLGVCSWRNKMYLDTIYNSITVNESKFNCKLGNNSFILDSCDENGIPLDVFRCVSGDCGFYNEVLSNRNKQLKSK